MGNKDPGPGQERANQRPGRGAKVVKNTAIFSTWSGQNLIVLETLLRPRRCY